MDKAIISTDKAPQAIGPYSQAIKVGIFIYTSGQIPLVPSSMELVSGGIEAQTRQVMENLIAVIEEAGGTASSIIKTTCFLKDMNHFAVFNEVYAHYFHIDPPARSCVEVARLPKDVLVEIEAVAKID
jgi:2-iminobutanoate/2-iminopropanoate deaminase